MSTIVGAAEPLRTVVNVKPSTETGPVNDPVARLETSRVIVVAWAGARAARAAHSHAAEQRAY